MSPEREIVVLCGAVSPERDVSLRSGRAVAGVLPGSRLVELDVNALPEWLDGERHVVLPVIHGDYGEDGAVQADLAARGIPFAGCDAAASRLCIDKVATKQAMRAAGVPAIPEVAFTGEAKPSAAALVRELGPRVVLKPADKGSSVGLFVCADEAEVAAALAAIPATGRWMAERRLTGRELSVGLLEGRAMGVVEIVPLTGVYDYRNKYTKGSAEYRFPAPLEPPTTAAIQRAAEALFAAGGCRDFARADVFLEPDGNFYFLEINTMPGMTETSLMPKSATCVGLDFSALVRRMLAPARQRARGVRLT
jgi:D-alanine-D-alanine ligase